VEGLRLRGVRDGRRGGLLVVDGWHHASGAVPALVVVEAVSPVDDHGAGLSTGVELVPAQHLPLQGGEQRLGGCIDAPIDRQVDQATTSSSSSRGWTEPR